MKKAKKKKKKVVYISADPIEAYMQGWKDSREDFVKRMKEKLLLKD